MDVNQVRSLFHRLFDHAFLDAACGLWFDCLERGVLFDDARSAAWAELAREIVDTIRKSAAETGDASDASLFTSALQRMALSCRMRLDELEARKARPADIRRRRRLTRECFGCDEILSPFVELAGRRSRCKLQQSAG